MAMRLAVVKSALRKDSRKVPSEASVKSISRSIMAPFGSRPTVGTPRTILAALPSALQALGVAHGGRGDVDAGALGGERRQIGRDHHRGDVAGADLLAADIDAE